ncbi:hypothetical protein FG386_000230 [Cryptosporidium ryanae]|uniref:uncharacterized protein n=1 Tax=Cryptosporidium ryanae TaxID=515981 RepID=UPI00351A91FB|nr:hypothetical protein FG386_000230 [Cryptosporidium ryanae]
MNKYALLGILIVLVINTFGNVRLEARCDGDNVRDVSPLVSEIFDLFLEHLENKKKGKYKINNSELMEQNIAEVNKEVTIFSPVEESNKPDLYFQPRSESVEMYNAVNNSRIFKVFERKITFNDNKVDIFLSLITENGFDNNSVLLFKPLNVSHPNYRTNLTQFCSSNINNEIFVETSDYSTLYNSNGGIKNILSFRLNYEIAKLLNKTFIICLSDSIQRNYSIYITHLSFSEEKNIKSETNDYRDQFENKDTLMHNINDVINYEELNNINILKYNFYDIEEDGKVLIRNEIKKNETCSDYSILVVDKKGKIVTTGAISDMKGKIDNICFWILTLTKDHFNLENFSDDFGIKVNYSPLFVLSVNKKSNVKKEIISIINYIYDESRNKVKLFNSILFKFIFLLITLIPIVLLAYCILIIVFDLIEFLLLNYKNMAVNGKIKLYIHNLNSFVKENKDFSENKSVEKKRMLNWYGDKKRENEKKNAEINKHREMDLSTHYDESGNSYSDNYCSDQHQSVLRNDPLKYFDSDCSLSTYTGM